MWLFNASITSAGKVKKHVARDDQGNIFLGTGFWTDF